MKANHSAATVSGDSAAAMDTGGGSKSSKKLPVKASDKASSKIPEALRKKKKKPAKKTGGGARAQSRKANSGSAAAPASPETAKAQAGAVLREQNPRVSSRPAKKGLPPIDPKTGKINQQALIEQYTPYVRSIAGKAKKGLSKDIEFSDLVSYGMVGLLEAAGRYDPKYGANFMTFSYYRIRGAIYDGLRNMGWVSRTEYAKHRFEAKANAFLANVADRQNYGDEGKTTEDEIEELADTVSHLVTIFVTSLEGMEHIQFEDKDKTPIDIAVGDEQMKNHLHEALERLPEQERKLIAMYYFKEMSLQQVGDSMGLSKSWTSRLHAKAVEKLSRILREMLRHSPGR